MKALTILLFTFLTVAVNKCSTDKDLKENLAIEYMANSRGLQTKVIIKNDSVVIMDQGLKNNVTYHKISDSDWKSIVKEVQKIDKDKVHTFNAPTNKRATDAARTAQIKVVYNGTEYDSNFFDEGFPPTEIKSFVDKVAAQYIKKAKATKK